VKVTPLIAILLLVPGFFLAPAQADDPVDVSTSLTDKAGVLDKGEAADVRRAASDFYSDTGQRLYVVYVKTFGDLSPKTWAAETAHVSGLGNADLLLAIATDDGTAAAHSKAFSDEDLDAIDRDTVEPALDEGEPAKAAVGAAAAYTDLADDSGLPWAWIVLGTVVLLGAAGLVTRRLRRRFERTHHVLDEHGNPVDPAKILSLDELSTVAARSLVVVDDALYTSRAELAHAEAQYGSHAVTRFQVTLDRARVSLREAFMLHRRLEALAPTAEHDRRRTAARIIAICEEVDHALDAHVEAFDRLRDLEDRVPSLLDGLAERAEALPSSDDEQADRLLTTARAQIERSRSAFADEDVRAAVSRLRAAEDSIAQIELLLDPTPVSELVAIARYVETRRGAIGAAARTCTWEAQRLDELRSAQESAALVEEARMHAEADVAAWRGRREQKEDRGSPGFEAMVLGGILVDRRRRGGIGNVIARVLGGSSHGGGSGERFSGSDEPGDNDKLRAPGSYGGTRTRGRRGGAGRF
jgi:uncharacterized membrane protein YgcG